MDHRTLMVGLPSSGKTTFLAALWHVLRQRDVPGALSLERLSGDEQYLNAIRDAWLTGRELDRTARTEIQYIDLHMADDQGDLINLQLPDLSGELFKDAISDRHWSIEFDQIVAETASALVFVHPNIKRPWLISEVPAIEVNDGQQPLNGATWDAAEMPTQVMLVELLQLLASRSRRRKLSVALIISAWDVVESITPGEEPGNWVRSMLPLLHQYLQSKDEPWNCYGISAQGGELPNEKDRLLQLNRASERVIVKSATALSQHDLTAPVRWLLTEG